MRAYIQISGVVFGVIALLHNCQTVTGLAGSDRRMGRATLDIMDRDYRSRCALWLGVSVG